MPLLKSDDLPISAEDVAALRARLRDPDQHEIVLGDGRRYLFVRCADAEPHPVADLERAIETVPGSALKGLSDIFLLGAKSDLHVPGHIARPILEARLRFDEVVAADARKELDVQFGLRVRRYVGDPMNAERLIVRIPRSRCAELSEADLERMTDLAGPLYESGALAHVRACHVVAEEDHVRLPAPDFLADLLARWNARATPTVPPSPLPATTAPPHATESAPDLRARPVIDVTPVFEVEEEIAPLSQDAPDEADLLEAEHRLSRSLAEAGFAIIHGAFLGDTALSFEAVRQARFPRTVAVVRKARVDRACADDSLRLVRERGDDLLILVALTVDADAERRLAASRVKVLKPDGVLEFRP